MTIALWYKREGATWEEGGLVSNGGCWATNSGLRVTTGYTGAHAGITTTDSFPVGLKQVFSVTVGGALTNAVRVLCGLYV